MEKGILFRKRTRKEPEGSSQRDALACVAASFLFSVPGGSLICVACLLLPVGECHEMLDLNVDYSLERPSQARGLI